MTDKAEVAEVEWNNVVPPKEVIAELKGMAEDLGLKDWTKIKEEFYVELSNPDLDELALPIEERCVFASKVLLCKYAEKMSYHTEKVEFYVIDKTGIKEIKKKPKAGEPDGDDRTYLATVFGIFAGAGESDLVTKPGLLNLWGDACQSLSKFVPGKAYISSFGVEEYENYYGLSVPDVGSIDLEESKLEIGKPADVINKFFPEVAISALEYNISKDNSDLKLVRGRIRSGRKGVSGNGNPMGFLTLMEGSGTLKDIKDGKSGSVSIIFFDSPDYAIRYTYGSEVYVLCEVQASEKYGVSCIGRFIIPIMAFSTRPTRPTAPKEQPKTYMTPDNKETPSEEPSNAPDPSNLSPEDTEGW